MRKVKPELLQERKQKLLQAIVHHYIKTAKPVGSHIITSDYGFDLSPATIRNLMVELEDEGYITHPHTSAGRVPTDKGYRLYVNSLIELQQLALGEQERVEREYIGRKKELDDLLVNTSKALSSLSHYTGFVITPRQDTNKLKFIELSQVSHDKLLVLFVTHTGIVKHKIIEATVPADKLPKLNKLLKENLKDLSLTNVKDNIFKILDDFEKQERDIITLAKTLSSQIFDIEEDIYLDGTSRVLELPEFHDYESMKCLLSLSEDKSKLMHIINDHIINNDINVMIGSEATCRELRNLSVVSSVYKDGDKSMGVLGIIGPKRMEYEKMMALVGAVSKIVNKLLSDKSEDK